jgi:two-component sensor histidine kinase
MPRWSLRIRVVAVVAVASLPIIAIAGWRSYETALQLAERRSATMDAAAELVVSRHRELIESSRRLLLSTCSTPVVLHSLDVAATALDLEHCQNHLNDLVQKFSGDYSAAIVTDSAGVTRCSSSPTAAGINLADREIFRLAREGVGFVIGPYVASRVTPRTVIPVAVPLRIGDRFRGMCAIGISLKPFADYVTATASSHSISVALVDRSGLPLGGDAEAAFALPVPARLASAISNHQLAFSDHGQNGALQSFRIEALAGAALFAVVAAPMAEGIAQWAEDWGDLALTVLVIVIMLLVVWLAAGAWIVTPLGQIQGFAARIARGEQVDLAPATVWGPEMIAVGEGIAAMAEAIASRETALHSGLEQRDHMLREIHHRVKNNLQMISSLLNLQAGEIRSPRIRRYFADAQNRVLTLSILHRHLYERSSWSLVDFQQFISDLVRQLSVGRPGVRQASPRFHIRAPIMAVGPDTAIPVGMIVTEAVGSALSHDFSAAPVPEVRIDAVEREGREVELVIEDNGRAGEASINPDSGGFGMTLIRGLAAQLGGEAKVLVNHEGGTRVVVTFPLSSEEASDG